MTRLIVAGLLAAAAAAPLVAQPVAPAQPMKMGMAATASRSDVPARVQAQFARRDANRDGFLTSEELGGRRDRAMQQRAMRNGGAMRDPNAAFDRLDSNRDGSISRDEFARGRELRIEKRVVVNQGQPATMGMNHEGMNHMGRGAGGMKSGRMMGGGMMGGGMLKMADANRDGKVSLAEATAGALRHFDMMDTNRDGRVTPDERAAGRAHMKAMRKAG